MNNRTDHDNTLQLLCIPAGTLLDDRNSTPDSKVMGTPHVCIMKSSSGSVFKPILLSIRSLALERENSIAGMRREPITLSLSLVLGLSIRCGIIVLELVSTHGSGQGWGCMPRISRGTVHYDVPYVTVYVYFLL